MSVFASDCKAKKKTLVLLLKTKKACYMGCSKTYTKFISIPLWQKHLLSLTPLVHQKRRPLSECQRLSKITNARNMFLARSQVTTESLHGLVSRSRNTCEYIRAPKLHRNTASSNLIQKRNLFYSCLLLYKRSVPRAYVLRSHQSLGRLARIAPLVSRHV
jgi:hypothetical protein